MMDWLKADQMPQGRREPPAPQHLETIFRLIVGQGLLLSAVGIGVGLAAALALTGVMQKASMLIDIKPTDPITYASIALLFVAIAAIACWVPARRAAGLDPNVALREE